MRTEEQTAWRLQGIAAGLAEIVRLHDSQSEVWDTMNSMGYSAADFQRAGAASYDLSILRMVERNFKPKRRRA